MNRETFEQLVSAWIDEPQRADLRERIEAAAAGDPQLAELRERCLRVDGLVR